MRRRHRSKIIELLGFIYFKPTNTVCGRAMMFAYERPPLAGSGPHGHLGVALYPRDSDSGSLERLFIYPESQGARKEP